VSIVDYCTENHVQNQSALFTELYQTVHCQPALPLAGRVLIYKGLGAIYIITYDISLRGYIAQPGSADKFNQGCEG
jgi:hypothetical protein